MCDISRGFEMVFVFSLIGVFISFVVGINWWSAKEAKKQFECMYGKGE